MFLQVYTSSGKNSRGFTYKRKKEALEYYNSIKHLERTELHYSFYAIYPEDLYLREADRNKADRLRKEFLQFIKERSINNHLHLKH